MSKKTLYLTLALFLLVMPLVQAIKVQANYEKHYELSLELKDSGLMAHHVCVQK